MHTVGSPLFKFPTSVFETIYVAFQIDYYKFLRNFFRCYLRVFSNVSIQLGLSILYSF